MRIRQASYENQQKLIADKQKTIERFRAKASKASMAQSMEKSLQKMEKLDEMVQPATLSDLPQLGRDILKGRVKGRVVVDVNA